MSPMQQILLGLGAVAEKTYIDEAFSTYLWAGSGSARSINNSVDMTEGGMTWIKKRSSSDRNVITDTVRGVTKQLFTERNDGESTESDNITSFNNNGFSLDTDNRINQSGATYSSWSFRKSKGFFDVVTFNETGAPHSDFTVSHSLGCIPGMIILKRTDGSSDWWVWHRYDPTGLLRLNTTAANLDMTNDWCIPTSTNFTFRPTYVGAMGAASWVAYLFAGGNSITDKAVDFDGTDDYLSIADHSDLEIGSSDFTMEAWVYMDANAGSGAGSHTIMSKWDNDGRKEFIFRVTDSGGQKLQWLSSADGSSNSIITGNSTFNLNQWNHVAATRTGSTIRIFLNGIEQSSTLTQGSTHTNTHEFMIGANGSSGIEQFWDGKISNVRVIKGRSLYTGDFGPNREELKNDPSTKLLCCNGSTTTSSTVTPGTITAVSSPSVSTNNSIFDDPAGFDFGDSGDQNVIKCGSYVGNGNADGPDVFLGWEPQWLMVKRVDSADEWPIYDSMRGIVTGGNDSRLYANQNAAEYSTNANYFALTPTGFKVSKASGEVNASGGTYIYLCIRRPDGYVSKPIELGSVAFNMDWGNSTSTESWTSGFPVDYAIYRRTHYVTNWFTSARLMQGKELIQDTTAAESAWTGAAFDSNTAWGANSGMDSSYLSYMWKRHKGFDVQRYTGKTGQQSRAHGLSVVPEMIWVKSTNNAYEWAIGHKDLTSGWTSKHLRFTNSGEITGQQFALAPTATHWTTPNGGLVNDNGEEYIAMLFSSITGVSAVGSYTGTSGSRWINVGFQPRFVLIKRTDGTGDWLLCDSMRGVDKNLYLNTTAASSGGQQISTSSTSFAITALGANEYNVNNEEYIYYCHA